MACLAFAFSPLEPSPQGCKRFRTQERRTAPDEVSKIRLWFLGDLESLKNSKTFEGSQRRKEEPSYYSESVVGTVLAPSTWGFLSQRGLRMKNKVRQSVSPFRAAGKYSASVLLLKHSTFPLHISHPPAACLCGGEAYLTLIRLSSL